HRHSGPGAGHPTVCAGHHGNGQRVVHGAIEHLSDVGGAGGTAAHPGPWRRRGHRGLRSATVGASHGTAVTAMIQTPRRSVTRFFIPLVDVMMLLFCIFLLMPMVKFEGEGSPYAKLSEAEKQLQQREERLGHLEAEIELLRRELGETPAELRKDLNALREEKL